MAFALKVVLLVHLSLAYALDTEDIEIVLLPLWNMENSVEVPLKFNAFDQSVELTLRRNDKIVTPRFQVLKHTDEDTVEEMPELSKPVSCHYLHRSEFSSAAISLCRERGMHGLIFLENATLEIAPVQSNEISFYDDSYVKRDSQGWGEAHIVKRAHVPFAFYENHGRHYKRDELANMDLTEELFGGFAREKKSNEALTLELALFFDEAAYNLFLPFFEGNDEELRDMLLAYVNAVQAIYHHPSLGVLIDISLVRLEIMQKQPRNFPHFNGDRSKLLDSFCNYAMKRNSQDDYDPKHWDMGLYVSGLDFYAMEDNRKNSATMGLATVGGLCYDQYSCVIAEFGITNYLGKPYPSAGFTSVYIAAHEIGHNLGMHHDSTGNTCPKDGYIMSPSRGTYGETIWSDCSRELAQTLSYTKPCIKDRQILPNSKGLEHTKFFDLPGREWNAKKQCEILLRDRDASVVTLYNACVSLQCKTPHRSGYYFAGPALDGTYCAPGKECRGGECRNALRLPPGLNESSVQPGGWSDWKSGPCSSACLLKSTGAQARRRTCNNPSPKNTDVGCQGLHYDVVLCRDDKLCKKKRKSIVDFAALKCADFSERLPELDGEGGGLQAPHEPERPWIACAIFCRRKDIASYYTPRVELNDLGLDPYFPDGTWCHTEEGQHYFCRQHHCLPEKLRFHKTLLKNRLRDDVELGLQNARPGGHDLDDRVIKYLSLGPDGLPLLTSLSHGIGFPADEDEWIDNDYVELTKPPGNTVLESQYLVKK